MRSQTRKVTGMELNDAFSSEGVLALIEGYVRDGIPVCYREVRKLIDSSALSSEELYAAYAYLEEGLLYQMKIGAVGPARDYCRTWVYVGKKLAVLEKDVEKRSEDIANIDAMREQIIGACLNNDSESLMELQIYYTGLITEHCGNIGALWEKGCL